MNNVVVWFEIPVKNMERAIKFYSKVMSLDLHSMDMGPKKVAIFPSAPNIVSGNLAESKGYVPGLNGPLIYLNGGEDLSIPLKQVEPAGGKVVKEKTSIGENDFMAIFEDTEGNRVALHSRK